MTAEPWFAFDHKLSWDGLLTFIGGLLAFFAILCQVRHADAGLKQQLQAEKDARSQESEDRKRAVATGLLYEIDRFYSIYIGRFLKILGEAAKEKRHPQVESPGTRPFSVYPANCGDIGELDKELVQTIVDFYALAQRHALRIEEYVRSYSVALTDPQGVIKASQVEKALQPGIKSACEELVLRAYIVCAYLCEYTEIEFRAGQFDVARGERMSEAELLTARDAIKNFRARMKGSRGETH